jgi:protein ImuA
MGTYSEHRVIRMNGNVLELGASPRDASRPEKRPLLQAGCLHEIHAARDDWAAASAFALSTLARDRSGMMLSLQMEQQGKFRAVPYGDGFAGLGIEPGRLVIVHAANALELLRAALEGARCPAIAGVVLETWGKLAEYDLTASRRLSLAAERSKLPVVVLRGEAEPRPSSAQTRWAIGSAPSTALPGKAPGEPAIEVELLRQRGGPAGMRWRLEWDAEYGCFRETAMPGAVVPLPLLRTGEEGGRSRAA